ncbi:hypothetical protein D3C76_25710 [compost metagenome]
MDLQNLFFPAVSVSDKSATFGTGVQIESTMDSLLEAIQKSEGLSELPDRSKVEVLVYADGNRSHHTVRYNKVLVGALKHPLDEHLIDYTGGIATEIPQWMKDQCDAQPNGEEWFKALREAVAGEKASLISALAIIDSLPQCLKDISNVGKTHVIVPDAENMTEDMIDASRSLLLYSDTFSTSNAPEIRHAMSLRKWTADNLPDWFKESNNHLTKGGRAALAYHLTLQAALNPPKEDEKYFKKTDPILLKDYGFELVLSANGHNLSIAQAFETLWSKKENGQMFDLQINRHQLPDEWKTFFRKQAIEISGTIYKGEAGYIELKNPVVRLGLKAEFADTVAHTFNPSADVPRKRS